MFKKLRSIIYSICIISILQGCATAKSYTSANQILASFSEGQTTLEEVKDRMGPPLKKEILTSEITRLTYNSFHYGKFENRYFWLYFKDGKLIRYSEKNTTRAELADYYMIGLIPFDKYEEIKAKMDVEEQQSRMLALSILLNQPNPYQSLGNSLQKIGQDMKQNQTPTNYTYPNPYGTDEQKQFYYQQEQLKYQKQQAEAEAEQARIMRENQINERLGTR